MKIYPVIAELFHVNIRADGQTGRRTDMKNPTVTFLNFAKAPDDVSVTAARPCVLNSSSKYYTSKYPNETQHNSVTFIPSHANLYLYYKLSVKCKVYKAELNVLYSQISAHFSYLKEMVRGLLLLPDNQNVANFFMTVIDGTRESSHLLNI
jgi:hypothetical protein